MILPFYEIANTAKTPGSKSPMAVKPPPPTPEPPNKASKGPKLRKPGITKQLSIGGYGEPPAPPGCDRLGSSSSSSPSPDKDGARERHLKTGHKSTLPVTPEHRQTDSSSTSSAEKIEKVTFQGDKSKTFLTTEVTFEAHPASPRRKHSSQKTPRRPRANPLPRVHSENLAANPFPPPADVNNCRKPPQNGRVPQTSREKHKIPVHLSDLPITPHNQEQNFSMLSPHSPRSPRSPRSPLSPHGHLSTKPPSSPSWLQCRQPVPQNYNHSSPSQLSPIPHSPDSIGPPGGQERLFKIPPPLDLSPAGRALGSSPGNSPSKR